MRYSNLLCALAAVSLTSCSANGDNQADDSNTTSQPNTVELDDDASASDLPEPMTSPITPDETSSPGISGEMSAKRFPPTFQGRWGLVAADCTSRMGDTKGLAVFSAGDIRFYESIGTIKAAKKLTERTFAGTLSYEGEGMQWDRETSISVAPDGQQLVLEEFGEGAVPGPRAYRKCG